MRRVFFLPAVLLAMVATGCGGTRYMQVSARIESAPPDKALVNFLRPTNWGGAVDCQIYNGDGKLVGNLDGSSECQYVCDPGSYVFIGDGESVSVIQATVAAGRIYDIMVDVQMGMWKANVQLHPLVQGDARRAKLPDFERRCRVLEVKADEDTRRREEKFSARLPRIRADFIDGEKRARLHSMGPDDNR